MKIRWTNTSVRLRITPEELNALVRGEPIREVLAIAGGDWTVVVFPHADRTELMMARSDLQIALAPADVQKLAAPDAEGVYFTYVEADRTVRYFIEKDFPCAHPRASEAAEPDRGTFTPPPDFEERKNAG